MSPSCHGWSSSCYIAPCIPVPPVVQVVSRDGLGPWCGQSCVPRWKGPACCLPCMHEGWGPDSQGRSVAVT